MEQFRMQQKQDHEATNNNTSAYTTQAKPLINRLGNPPPAQDQRAKCMHCGRKNHKAADCYHASKPKCTVCKKIGHKEDQCRFKKKSIKPCLQKDKFVAKAIAPKKEAHITEAEEEQEEEIAATAMQNTDAMLTDEPLYATTLYDNVEEYDVNLASTINKASQMYDWLADSGSTHHITNQCKMFSLYEPTPEATIHSVGGKIIRVLG
jgi:hypothetical protein